jgi:glycosyltransferase involved in cell wall biosynthesis
MRVCLDCRMASWSGVGRYTVGLARALAQRGDVELLQVHAEGQEPPVAPREGVRAVPASAHPFGIQGALEFGRILRKAEPEIVHSPHFPTPLPAAYPLVVTLHDLIPLMLPAAMPSLPRRIAYRAWNARAVRVADRILADSRFAAGDIMRLFPAAGGKLRVVHLSADDFAGGPIGEIDEELVPAGTPFLLSMGNTKPHKDLPTLLKAFERVSSDWPRLRLLLVGPEASGFVASVLPAGEVAGRVRFTGNVDDRVLRALYRGAAVFVLPSRCEGFGLPPLEAMAFGTPVVCSDAASLPEVVGSAALLFPAGDAESLASTLSLVLGDASERKRLSLLGPKRAAQFTWKRTAEGTVAVYREALASSLES